MFNTEGFVDGQEFQIQFVAEPKDLVVRRIVAALGVHASGPVDAVFHKAGTRTMTGAWAFHDTVCVRTGRYSWGGLWPHEDGADYTLA